VTGTRLGAALALALSVAAVALATAALLTALRDDETARGRLVQTRLVPSESPPVLFPLDEFYASTGEDGILRALYIYPPGYFGHSRGCAVVWLPDGVGPGGRPGVFMDPCGASRFGRDGSLLEGPADRGLDRFKTEPGIEGVFVDTRTLYCGPPYVPLASPQPTAPPHVTTATVPASAPLATASPAGGAPTALTQTPAPTATASETATSVPTSQPATLEECGRVSPDAD
jgi:hypothetical protein